MERVLLFSVLDGVRLLDAIVPRIAENGSRMGKSPYP